MKFSDNVWLLLIPVLTVGIVLLYVGAALRSRRALKKLLGSAADDPATVRLSRQRRFWRVALLTAAVLLLVVAVARPYWNTAKLPGGNAGRDVLVLFDVSKSMRATDVAPSRLEQAKYLLRQLAADLPQDRFGLIAFAGNAYLSCPLTADKSAFDEYVGELDTDTVPLGGTNIERALNVADRAFSAAEGDHRAVLLVTDGDELTGNAENAAKAFAQKKIPIITVGLGDPAVGAPIPDGKGAMIRDKAGELALSKLNEAKLAELSKLSGGIYVRSTTGDPGTGAVEAALAKLGSRQGDGAREVPEERFVPFLIAAWILLLLSALIPERTAPKKAVILFALLGVLTLNGAEAPAEIPIPPTASAEALYNLALEKQRAGENGVAAKYYEEVVKRGVNNPLLQSRALFNSGVFPHQEARNFLEKAQQQLKGQQLDNALKELESATQKLKESGELYGRALTFDQADFSAGTQNFTQLELDRRQIEELKKKIEELKKQQQKARDEAKKAQRQNQQKKQDKQQNQQQQQQAQKEAEKLERQAKALNQKEMEKQAKEAKEELQKARQTAKPQEAQAHLDKAVKALGEEKKEPQKSPQDQPQPGKKEEKKEPPQSAAAGKEEKKQKERSGSAKLQLLNDEEKNLRDAIRSRQQMQRPQVEKDW